MLPVCVQTPVPAHAQCIIFFLHAMLVFSLDSGSFSDSNFGKVYIINSSRCVVYFGTKIEAIWAASKNVEQDECLFTRPRSLTAPAREY